MSRFLHHLAARAVGLAGITPRAQTLFEPASTSAPQPATAPGATVPPTRPLRDTGETQTHVTANALRMQGPQVREPVDPQAAAPRELPRSSPTQRPRFERQAVTARRGEAPGEQATAETEQKESGEHSSLIQPIAREPAARPALVATQPLPIVVPRSTATNRLKEPVAQGESPHMEPVRVTIGRVEVRAVMAPQPQRAAARTAPPSLPLDDYLRNRGKA